MFKPSDQVVCVDDTNPNPNSTYPSGCVVAGTAYTVIGIADEGGLIIQGKPVIGRISGQEAGWKRRRFRRFVAASEGLRRRMRRTRSSWRSGRPKRSGRTTSHVPGAKTAIFRRPAALASRVS